MTSPPAGQATHTRRARPSLSAEHPRRAHILTVGLEDYYHTDTLDRLVLRSQWTRLESRLQQSTHATLELLEQCRSRATFFVTGWIAELVPDLVREVRARGHEVASRGFSGRRRRDLTDEQFLDDARRSRELLEEVIDHPVLGFRTAQGWLDHRDDATLRLLAEAGYRYDSSLRPLFRLHDGNEISMPHWRQLGPNEMLEVPVSSIRVLGLYLPIGGGNYFRQLPRPLMRRAVEHYDRAGEKPHVMYFHTWELDSDQPRIRTASVLQRLRQYRNLTKMPEILREYLTTQRYISIAEYFGLDSPSSLPEHRRRPSRPVTPQDPAEAESPMPATRVPVTVVVPCFNEAETLTYLAKTLHSVQQTLATHYALTFLFVDDCSTDATWSTLQQLFGKRDDCLLARHEQNQGVARAIQTGIVRAETEVVCSIDCDCSYDPMELARMIPLLEDDVACVLASPYHRSGGVMNVPPWRLFLSRSLSRIYQLVLRQRLATYTSCFRVYRQSVTAGITLDRGGFFGITELVGRLDLAGHRVVEYPTVLHGRLLGVSKMKVARTIPGT